jgi:hypothetical protein
MRGARKTENELRTVTKVAALFISCQGWMIQAAVKVMIAPRRMSMYLGKMPARSIPPATALPQTFWNRIANVNASERKKTPALAADDPFPSIPISADS